MKKEPCGCEYDGPVQVLCCGEHNIPARNLNRAQVMINEKDMEIHFLKETLKKIVERSNDPKIKKLAGIALEFKLPREVPFTREELERLIDSPFKSPPESKSKDL
jgi:hypothetical protein